MTDPSYPLPQRRSALPHLRCLQPSLPPRRTDHRVPCAALPDVVLCPAVRAWKSTACLKQASDPAGGHPRRLPGTVAPTTTARTALRRHAPTRRKSGILTGGVT
jgi:hypothetical protein